MNDIGKTFADNLIKYRKKNQMTQSELADKVGISVNSIRNYEKADATRVTLHNVKAIADVFGITVSELCGEDREKKSITIETYRDLFEAIIQLKGLRLDCGRYKFERPSLPECFWGTVKIKCEHRECDYSNDPYLNMEPNEQEFESVINIIDKTTHDFFEELGSIDRMVSKGVGSSTHRTLNDMRNAWLQDKLSEFENINITSNRDIEEAKKRENNRDIGTEFPF